MQRTLRLVEITGVSADRIDELPARFCDMAIMVTAAERRGAENKAKNER